MDVKFIIFVFLFAICTTQAFHSLIPEGKELVYEYEGTISASTHIPRPYASSFALHGNLHVQRDNQTVFVKFSDLTYKLFNGLDDEYDSKILPIPEQMEAFSKAFRIEYQPTGNIAGIATGKDEKQYVVNFKKGISSMLQLDLEMIGKCGNDVVYVFQTVENTIYGKGKVDYTLQLDKDTLHIDVMQNPHCTHHMYTHLLSNVDYESAVGDFEEPLNRESRRSFVLTKVDNAKIVQSIQQRGGISNTPFNGQGEAHVVYMNQSLVLKSTKPISSKMEVESEIYYEDLTYYLADLDTFHLPDITNGRRKRRLHLMVDQAITLTKELIDYVDRTEIDDTRPDFKKGQILNRLSKVMLSFEVTTFDEMHDKLQFSNDTEKYAYLSVFHQMLTQLGTHAAYRYIMKLNEEKLINDQSFMYNMFANVKFPNKKLVDEMAEILKWDSKEIGPRFYGAAILSFGTLLNKAVERNKRYTYADPKYGFNPDNKLKEEFPDQIYYEKYVVDLVGKLKATEKYEEQILYLQALHNTKMESIVEHLLPAVNGDWWKDSNLRMMAAFAISPILANNEELTFKIYWPFVINPAIPTSFRILSYYMIMKSQPRLPKLANIYWVMESIKNHELYMFHYQFITALSKTENPRNRKFIVHLRQILKYTSKPVFRGLTEYYHFDYFNEAYSFGEEMDLMTIQSKHENDIVLAGSYQSSENGLTTAPYWVYLRISGFHPSLLQALKLDTTSKTMLFTWETLKKVMLNLDKSDDAKVTFIFAKNGNVIFSCAFDQHSLMEFLPALQSLMTTKKMYDGGVDVSYELSKTIILPTDMGFPAISFNHVPDIDHTLFTILREDTDDEIKLSFDILYKSLRNSGRGLSFYNPVLDVFQGVSKLHSLDQKFHFRFNTSIDTAQHTLKVLWEKQETPNEQFFAERSYTDTMVYVSDDFKTEILQKSSSNSKNFEFVTLGEEYKTNHTIQRFPLIDFAAYYNEFVFDQEEPLPKELDTEIDIDSAEYRDYLRSAMQSLRFEELQPKDMSYGLFRTIQVSDFYPVEKIDMTLKLDAEYKKGNNYLYPAATYKMKFHYVAGSDNETLSVWRANAKLEMDDGHMNNVFSARISKFYVDKEVMVCIEGDTVWSVGDSISIDPDFKSTLYLSSNLVEGELCGVNNSLVTIQMHGEKSEEQKESDYSYHTCHENVKGPIEKQKSLECLFEYDSLRKYTISLKHLIPDDQKNEFLGIFKKALSKVSSNSRFIGTLDDIKSNEMRTIFYLPMRSAASLKLYVYTEDSGTSYDIPNEPVFGGINTVYGSMFEFMHDYGLTEMCVINNHKGKLTNIIGEDLVNAISDEWSLFLGTSKTGPKFEIWMKSADGNNMVLKFVFKTHTLVVEPKDSKYVFTVDGEEMNAEKTSYTNKWLYYAWVQDTQIVSIYVKNIGIHAIYNGHQASIEYPQIEGVDMHGHCLDRV